MNEVFFFLEAIVLFLQAIIYLWSDLNQWPLLAWQHCTQKPLSSCSLETCFAFGISSFRINLIEHFVFNSTLLSNLPHIIMPLFYFHQGPAAVFRFKQWATTQLKRVDVNWGFMPFKICWSRTYKGRIEQNIL